MIKAPSYILRAVISSHRLRTSPSTPTSTPRQMTSSAGDRTSSQPKTRLKGIVFDVDGTLCLPQNYMFKEMRDALGIQKPTDILSHITSLSEPARSDAKRKIEEIERRAMTSQTPQPGLREMVEHFTRTSTNNSSSSSNSNGNSNSTTSTDPVHLALCTRNFELPVQHLLDKFLPPHHAAQFWPIVTRETEGVAPKPSPEGIWACVYAWTHSRQNTAPSARPPHNPQADAESLSRMSEAEKIRMCEGVVMVGDSVDDIVAGCRAGASTVLLVNADNRYLVDGERKSWDRRVDFVVERLDELVGVLEGGWVGGSRR